MPAKFDRCVRHLETEGKVRSPYAVCKAKLKKTKAGGKAAIPSKKARKRSK